jgi:hypothetical protein
MKSTNILKYAKRKGSSPRSSALLEHPIRENCEEIDGNRGFHLKNENLTFPGVTRRIKEVFYPGFKHIDKNKKRPRKGTCSSISIGNRVHSELFHITNCKDKCLCKEPPKKRLHRFTKKAIDKFKEMEITIEESEVMIVSRGMRLGTRLDLVGTMFKGQENESMVVVSIKTGIPGTYRNPQKMNAPLDFLGSEPRNHNQLQGMIEHIILDRDYGIDVQEYLIMYLGKDGVIVESLESWCRSKTNRDNVFSAVSRAKH